MGTTQVFHPRARHNGLLALTLALGMTGCAGLLEDSQPSLLPPVETTATDTVLPAEPVAIVEGLVETSGDGTCSVTRLADSGDGTLTAEEAQAGFACLSASLPAIYGASPHVLTRQFGDWARVDRAPFEVAALENRYAAVYANERALSEDLGNLHRDRGYHVGATLAAVTFSVEPGGALTLGPLVFVEKMPPGYTPLQGNWRYTFVGPKGDVQAVTMGTKAEEITLCAECTHNEADLLYLSLLNNGQIPL